MALKDFHHYENHYYDLNRRLLEFIGLWPYLEISQQSYRVRFINTIFFLSILTQTYILLVPGISVARTIEIVPTILPVLCFTSVYNNLYYHYDTRRHLFDRIRSDWTELTDHRKLDVMRKYARENKLYTLSITVLFWSYATFLTLPSIISVVLNTAGMIADTQLTLPIPMNFQLKNKLCFYFILLIQFVYIYLTCMVGIALYGTYIGFIQHTYALCAIVIVQLDHQFKRKSNKSCHVPSRSEYTKEYYWYLGVIIYYKKVTSFVDSINATYDITFLADVITGLLFFIADYFYFYELIDKSTNFNEILKFCLYTLTPLFIACVLCSLGQKLIDYSVDISIKCCQVPFYNYSLKTQKALLLLIMRTMRPIELNMKGIVVVSHELFANIVRTSFSFATVFFNMR